MQPLRTLLFVPGSRQSMLERARDLDADVILLDLEDSVPPEEKAQARERVRAALPALLRAGRRVWVRVNSTYTNLTRDDVRATIVPGVEGILLPKADSAAIVRYAEGLLRDQEARANIASGAARMIAAIESAAALLQASETARASPRLIALAFGAEDYTADLGIERTPAGEELMYARHAIAVAARAAGLLAVDTVYPRLHDEEGLSQEARRAKQAGFRGKLLIHPQQIAPVRAVFTPSEVEQERAQRIVAAYRHAEAEGRGAVQVDGAMVDAPVAKRALALLELAGGGDANSSSSVASRREGEQGSGSTPRPA